MSNPYDSGYGKGSSVLGPTFKLKGELKADEDLLVSGTIEGTVKHSSNLKVGKEGRLKAEVHADYIEVHGEVEGDLTGAKSVVVMETANVSGNLHSPSVSLHPGAKFNGSIDMSAGNTQKLKTLDKQALDKAKDDTAKPGAPAAANEASAGEPTSAQKRKNDAA